MLSIQNLVAKNKEALRVIECSCSLHASTLDHGLLQTRMTTDWSKVYPQFSPLTCTQTRLLPTNPVSGEATDSKLIN